MLESSPRLARLRSDLQAGSPDALEEFWREVTAAGTPLIEPGDGNNYVVTFLWRGEAKSTSIAWSVYVSLERLPGTDLWYGSIVAPADLRTIYCIAHDGIETLPRNDSPTGPSHVDTLNPERLRFRGDPDDPDDYDQWVSVLTLPDAPPDTWSVPDPAVARGSVNEVDLPNEALGKARRVSVYRPAGVATDGLASLVVFDGFLSRTMLAIPTTLDNLIAAGKIPPVVAFLVSCVSDSLREKELVLEAPILDFTARELMPWARKEYRISEDPKNCLIAGASRGGLVAAYIGLNAPDVFGAVISQSGSFWWPSPLRGEPEELTREFATRPVVPLRFYLDVGTREDMPGPDGAPNQLLVNRRMRDTLLERGYPVVYAEYSGGHDYVNWRRTFADALIALIGTDG